MKIINLFFLSLLLISSAPTFAQERSELTVNLKKQGALVQPTMYGLFFEDINFAADGGLYAELVKNRSFDFPQNLMGWNTFGNVTVSKEKPLFDQNPAYLILTSASHKEKRTGIENEGFRGIGFKKDNDYRFSVWSKTLGSDEQKLRVELINSKNSVIAKQELVINSPQWKKYELTLKAGETEAKGRLRIFLISAGTVAMEHVSLFPADTYKGRSNGLRADLAQALEDLNPGIFRFPGGCIVEGTDLQTRYDWKKSIGQVENRPLNENRWNYTFAHRLTPDYFQTYGLGFYEYFLLSEDLGAEPLPVVNVGLSCQYQNSGEHCHVPVGELDEYIQDALDLIEFANGAPSTQWGKVRAEMGHPQPFNLKFIGVGNEQWGKEYVDRLEPFIKAIRTKYPEIKIIGGAGPNAEGKEFEYLWPEMKRLKVDLVDEHYYRSPEWFLSHAARYDNYDRKGPKVFAGEYACHPKNRKNNFESALCEAAFMTGLERNADIVHMCTYAPLFAHVDAWQWNPDMIWFDNLRMVKTPNYYVQQIYAANAGTNVVSLTQNGQPLTGQNGIYASAVVDVHKKEVIVKLANTNSEAKSISIRFELPKKIILKPEIETVVMHNEPDADNTLDAPNGVLPQISTSNLINGVLEATAGSRSFYMFKIKY